MHYTHEHLEIQNTLRRFIDEQINPHVDEWEAAEPSGARGVQAARRTGPAGAEQARGLGRRGARLLLRDGDGRGARPCALRRRADGDRRADRHVHAGAGTLRQRRTAARVSGAGDRGRSRLAIGRPRRGRRGSDRRAFRRLARRNIANVKYEHILARSRDFTARIEQWSLTLQGDLPLVVTGIWSPEIRAACTCDKIDKPCR